MECSGTLNRRKRGKVIKKVKSWLVAGLSAVRGICLRVKMALTALVMVWSLLRGDALETMKAAMNVLQIKRALAANQGKVGMEALFSLAILGIVLIVFVMKLAPTMFAASNEVQSLTGTDAPDATSKTFMGFLPWVFIAIFVVVILVVLIGYTRRGRRG